MFIEVAMFPSIVNATEGYMCDHYYQDVHRKNEEFIEYNSKLSALAQKKLLKDLEFDIKQCISECEKDRFLYCNDAANRFSKKINQLKQ